MKPEVRPAASRPHYVSLACHNRPMGRPPRSEMRVQGGCSGRTQYLPPDTAVAAWAKLQAGRLALGQRRESVELRPERCRCGLRLPCERCIDLLDFTRSGAPSSGAMP